jgi:LPXTG-motif cell wall-anchored protein
VQKETAVRSSRDYAAVQDQEAVWIPTVGLRRRARTAHTRQADIGTNMDTNTLLIILVVLLLVGGGGFFYRRRI